VSADFVVIGHRAASLVEAQCPRCRRAAEDAVVLTEPRGAGGRGETVRHIGYECRCGFQWLFELPVSNEGVRR